MSEPRVAFLIHGGPESIEAVRARGLAQGFPGEQVEFLFRQNSRAMTRREWNRRIAEFKPDLLHVVNCAMPGALVAWERSLFHGLPYILDTGDVIYEMARTAGTEPFWKLPFLRCVESMVQRQARTIVVRGTGHRELLLAAGRPRVRLLRDGFVPRPEPEPKLLEQLRARYQLSGSFVVGVMGSLVFSPGLGICYGWDLVKALALLRDLPVRGLVIGDGPGRPWLEELARKEGVGDRIAITGRVPYEEVPAYLRLMDVALSTQTNNLPGQVRTTGKLPEYMAAERFILASRVGEATLLLPELMLLDYHGEVDAEYPARLAGRVQQLHGRPELLEARRALPELARKHCSYEVLSAEYRRIVEESLAR